MELPAIKLPAIELPFDIPTLMHPPVDHFAIAIPILVLLIEIINLIVKKRAIGVLSFALLAVGAAAMVAAYFTGVHDGKEAFDALSQAGQSELKEHKLMGSYLVVASMVVLAFKMLSALIKRGMMKILYFLVLLVFIVGVLKQGKDGGELVYEFGANVERAVADSDSELHEKEEGSTVLKEEIRSASEKVMERVKRLKEASGNAVKSALEKGSDVVKEASEAVEEKAAEVAEKTSEVVQSAKEGVSEAAEAVVEKAAETETASVSEPTISETPDAAIH